MKETIQTKRLSIAPFAESDRTLLSMLLTDDAIKKTYLIPDFDSETALLGMIYAFLCLSRDENRFVRGIYHANELIGFVNDVEIEGREIELGYVIAPAHQNKGFATEMLEAVLSCLLEADFDVVRTGAFCENAPSIRVMEKCGMERSDRTEQIEYRGQIHNCVYYEKR